MNLALYKKIIFVFVFIMVLFRMLHISVFDETRGRNSIFGDGFSDINTLSSAWYFHDHGFVKTAFLPVHEYQTNSNEPQVYTHYPALPNILAGFYSTILDSKSESSLRIFPFLLSIAFFFLIYFILNEWIATKEIAFLAASILVCSNYFIAWADNLHQHLYGEMLKWTFTYLLYKHHENQCKSISLYLTLFLIMMIQVNISFEQPVILGIMTLGFAIVYQKRIFTAETIGFFIALCLGFGLHLYQNTLYFGSWNATIEDLKHAFVYRTTGGGSMDKGTEAAFSFVNIFEFPFIWFNRLERYFILPGWFVLTIYLLHYKQIHALKDKAIQLIWVFAASALIWSFVMSQHAYIHSFTAKHFAFWYGIITAYALSFYIPKVLADFKDKNYSWMAFHTINCLYALIMFVSQHVFELYLKFGLLYPFLGKN